MVTEFDLSGVYLVGSRVYGWYKIGLTTQMFSRYAAINGFVPFDMDTAIIWPVEDRVRVEASLHMHFSCKRLKNEWFALTPSDLRRMDALVERFSLAPIATRGWNRLVVEAA